MHDVLFGVVTCAFEWYRHVSVYGRICRVQKVYPVAAAMMVTNIMLWDKVITVVLTASRITLLRYSFLTPIHNTIRSISNEKITEVTHWRKRPRLAIRTPGVT